MSPKEVSTSVRGIGVAVITSMSGASPLAVSASRWWTPKRCCSSTTTSARSWNSTPPGTARACRRRCRSRPLARPPSDRRRARGPSRGRSGSRRDAGARRRAARWCAKCWRARISVGAISAAWPPASTTRAMASSATTVLPEPTSPCSSRSMRSGSARSASISASACSCAAGQRIGQGGADLRCDARRRRVSGRPDSRRCCARTSASASWPARSSS